MTAIPTRRRLSADLRREQLQAAAIEIVARDGFAAAVAETICRQAGVSKGLLWHYFDNLDDLLANAARQAFAVLEAAVAESIDLDGPIIEVLHDAVLSAARLPRTHSTELRAVNQIAGNLRAPDGSPRLDETEYAALYAGQAELMRRGQIEGSVRNDVDAYVLATIYQGLVDSMVNHLDSNLDLDHERYAESVAAVLITGLAASNGD